MGKTLAKKTSYQRLFPDTTTAAYYDPFSQIINLCKYDRSDFEKVNIESPEISQIEIASLFEHELTHWLDHISTLWGQRNLVQLFNALNARAEANINEFWRVKTLTQNFQADDFYDYFTEEHPIVSTPVKTPWKHQITCGIRFDNDGKPLPNKPILFVRFNSFDDNPLIRIPVSVASILESNAINSEYKLKYLLINKIEDKVEKELQLTRLKTEWSSILYERDFALYTVIAHLTANLNNQTDVVWSYQTSASIGTLLLNFTDNLFDLMELTHVGDVEWDRRIKQFQHIKDRGFAFYNLLKNLVDKKGQQNYTIENLLESSNLPPKDEITDVVHDQMWANLNELIDGPFKKKGKEIISKGIDIFKLRGIDGSKEDFRSKFNEMKYFPNTIFGDTYFDDSKFNLFETLEKLKVDQDLDIEEHYFLMEYFDGKFGEFVKACGI